ncbi:MAG: hypothetical protein AABW41_01045 [Nanoarchaeota archaeon]
MNSEIPGIETKAREIFKELGLEGKVAIQSTILRIQLGPKYLLELAKNPEKREKLITGFKEYFKDTKLSYFIALDLDPYTNE